MLATPLANLNVRVGADIKEFRKMASKMEKAMDPMRQKLKSIGASMTLYVTAPLAAIATKGVMAWDKQAKAIAKVENAVKSTAGAAGKSLEELQTLASDLQSKTLFGDEEILNDATAQLLTFTNIAGTQFERTQAVALDLATMLDGDLKSASIQLGKALNAPVQNLSALSRSGIQFTEDQKTLINSLAETGRMAEAQNVILTELERQYGGTAAAAAQAGTGPLTQLSNTLGDITEEIGAVVFDAIMPLVDSVRQAADWFIKLSDGTKRTIITIGAIAAAIGPLLASLGGLLKIVPLITAGFTLLTGPIGLVVAAGAALAAGAVMIYRNWDKVRGLFDGPLSGTIEKFKSAFQTIKDVVADVFESVGQLVSGFSEMMFGEWSSLMESLQSLWDTWGGFIISTANFFLGHVLDSFTTFASVLADLFGGLVDLLTGDWAGLWDRMKSIVSTITGFIARRVIEMSDLVLQGIEQMFSWIPGVESVVAKARAYINDLRDDFAKPIELGPVVPNLSQSGGDTGLGSKPSSTGVNQESQLGNTISNDFTSSMQSIQGSGLESLAIQLPPVDSSILVSSLSEAADMIQPEMSRIEEYFTQTAVRLNEAMPQIAETITAGFQEAAFGLLEGIGKMLVGAESSKGIVLGLMSSLADLAVRVGKIAVQTGLAAKGISLTLRNPALAPVAIAAGAALIALGSAAKASLSSAASGGGGGSVGASAGFGEQSITQNANTVGANSVNSGGRTEIPEVRVILENGVTPAGDIEYSAKQGGRRLERQGTDAR